MKISVVIPVRNEEKNVPELIRRLDASLTPIDKTYQIIFVTDVNTDETYQILKEAHRRDPRIKVLKLLTVYGHHVAVYAGLTKAQGDLVAIMDGDLQDYPEDIPALVDKVGEGYDIVYGLKERKNDSSVRNALSQSFHWCMRWLSDYPMEVNTSMFRVISRPVVDAILQYKERDPSLTFIMGILGFRTASIHVHSGVRLEGRTNYPLWRQMNLAINSILSFSTKPLRIISTAGFTVSFMSFLYLLVVIVQKLFFGIGVKGWPTIVVIISFLGGLQLFSLGIIGEYIGKIFLEVKKRPLFVIEKYLE